ncbi:MAG: peptide-methionine (S)-S-oxide reductase MsrA [Verrucomicrobiales bacterium]|jgi:peptide-methionine (S)-S-oxide reductase|nr:peptide-methionine (S)-S-oxide reductase MsrA [Verrucomicrobiales bacterium]
MHSKLALGLSLAALFFSGVTTMNAQTKTETITLGTGCFWCSEAVFERVPGVISAVSGYSGGTVANPSYEQVCSGNTGHAECVQVTFDSAKTSLEKILAVFWEAHDPTTLNRQGADIGTQYRSVIFYRDEQQKQIAEKSKATAQKEFTRPIVTEITPFKDFYKAEDYHQEYFKLNGRAPYCQFVIAPKVKKLEQEKVIPANK